MTKEFIPYQQALELKELGFDEPCFAFYDGKGNTQIYFNLKRDASGDYEPFTTSDRLTWFGAPTYSQAFRFFREKHGLDCYIDKGGAKGIYHAFVSGSEHGWIYGNNSNNPSEFTYEEAELECLKKLIELSKDI